MQPGDEVIWSFRSRVNGMLIEKKVTVVRCTPTRAIVDVRVGGTVIQRMVRPELLRPVEGEGHEGRVPG